MRGVEPDHPTGWLGPPGSDAGAGRARPSRPTRDWSHRPRCAVPCVGLLAGANQILRADENLRELAAPAAGEQVAQRVPVERRHEGFDGLVQLVAQTAVIRSE